MDLRPDQRHHRRLVLTGAVAHRDRSPVAVSRTDQQWSYFRMLTARARTRAVVERAMALCSAINDFAHRDSGTVSVGENAMTFVKLV